MTAPLPPLPPAEGPILVIALSGLGKSRLAERYPDVAHDTDRDLDAVLAHTFPQLAGRARRIAWRALCRSQPWRATDTPEFVRWASTRRALIASVVGRLREARPSMVLSNLLMLPWPATRHYGVTLGGYAEHWRRIERDADNAQDEALNARLEGFSPLVRLAPGRFLSDEGDLLAWLEDARRVTAG